MENFRTNSLFHYTGKEKNLLSILKEKKLYAQYCYEELGTSINQDLAFGIPQICFCDIPVSMATKMREYYGNYAIAFSKDWGIEKGCNPIFYIKDERVLNSYVLLLENSYEYLKQKKCNEHEKIIDSYELGLSQSLILGYVKLYMGTWEGKDYCNYEENEWRYIIENSKHTLGKQRVMWKTIKEYKQWRGDVEAPKPNIPDELKDYPLEFSYNDINCIYVEKDTADKVKQKIKEFAPELIEKIQLF